MKKVLLLGKNGMLGSDLKYILDDTPGIELTAYGHQDLDILKVSDINEKIREIKPDIIINAVAATHVDKCEDEQKWAYSLNADSVGYLAKAAKVNSAKLIHFSTDYVFDGSNPEGYAEDEKTNPISVYGKSKLKGEENVISENGDYAIFRICWLFGKARNNFVDFVKEMSSSQAEITLINDQFGHPSYTKDLATGVKDLLNQNTIELKGIFHLFNSGITSRLDQAKFIFENLGATPKIKEVSVKDFLGKAPRPMYSILKNTKLPPLRSWQEATLDYLNN